MNDKRLNIAFEPDFKNVDKARAAISNLCLDVFKNPESKHLIEDFCLAATESMNNAVEHSGAKLIEVELFFNDREAFFRIKTEGGEFDPALKRLMPALNDADELPEGGFGIAIIQELVDSIDYEYVDNRNVLTLRKVFLNKN